MASNPTPVGAPRVLVINDNPEFLEMIEDLLEDEGYAVSVFAKSQGAIERVREARPDVVVLDVMFGHSAEGWALLDMIKLEPSTKDIPILVCSAATKEVREIAPSLDAKGISYLEKPFELNDFVERLNRLLGRAASSSGLPAS
jgi:CheY-like chemotaxis protein